MRAVDLINKSSNGYRVATTLARMADEATNARRELETLLTWYRGRVDAAPDATARRYWAQHASACRKMIRLCEQVERTYDAPVPGPLE